MPVAAELDAKGEFPLDNIREMGQLGLMGIEVPEAYGGAGIDPIAYVLAMIEIAAADAATATVMSVNNSLFCNGILKHGNEAQKQQYVRAIATGEAIGAYALTEPQSGSDASAMHTRATKNANGDWVINGKKSWITSGPVARYIVLFAISTPGIGAKGVSAFIIDTQLPGFHAGKTEPKLGIRASATCEIEFTDYVCPKENLLGDEGKGFSIAMGVLDAGRIGIASQAVGIARAAYEATLQWSRDRKAFGVPIGTFQMTQSKIADMKCKLDAATLLTLRAAWTKSLTSFSCCSCAAFWSGPQPRSPQGLSRMNAMPTFSPMPRKLKPDTWITPSTAGSRFSTVSISRMAGAPSFTFCSPDTTTWSPATRPSLTIQSPPRMSVVVTFLRLALLSLPTVIT
ncbi:Crotonobetainyl-CoA reductase [Rhodanobacter lindaniclasticus]